MDNINYATGIKKLDDHHDTLINTVSIIINFVLRKEIASASTIANTLAIALRHHCDEEEKVFAKTNYPYSDEHVRAHTELITKLDRVCLFLGESLAKQDAVAWEITSSLYEIFLDHVELHDLKFARFLKSSEKSTS
jgi:hemerythrin-like metal-binding protein